MVIFDRLLGAITLLSIRYHSWFYDRESRKFACGNTFSYAPWQEASTLNRWHFRSTIIVTYSLTI